MELFSMCFKNTSPGYRTTGVCNLAGAGAWEKIFAGTGDGAWEKIFAGTGAEGGAWEKIFAGTGAGG